MATTTGTATIVNGTASPRAAHADIWGILEVWNQGPSASLAESVVAFFGSSPPSLTTSSSPGASTVIVVGWAGASTTQLSPIVDWHATRGNTVLTLLPDLFGDSDGEQLEALAAVPAEHASWLHIFSNNGAFFIRRVVAAQPRLLANLDLRGCVLDSAPHELHCAEEASASGPKALAAHMAASFGLSEPEELLQLLAEAQWRRRLVSSQPVELLGSVVLPSRVPRFCIYGSTDTVVNARAVEAFIAAERAKGELVTGRRLNSGHVSHHLTHTVEYWREVGRFMDS